MTSSVPAPRPSEGPRCMVLIRNPGGDWIPAHSGDLLTHAEAKQTVEAIQSDEYAREVRAVGVLMSTSIDGRRSPSVPEATQDDIRGRAYVAGWLDGETHGATHGVGTGYEQARAKAEGQAARYVAAYKPAKLDKPISPAVPSSEEAANSDTDRLDWLEANGGFSHDDVDRGMSMSQWGRNWDKITLREAIDKAKLAARVQGENRQ